MKKNLKSILSLGVVFTFVVLPTIAAPFEYNEKIRDNKPKGVIRIKDFSVEEDEFPLRRQGDIEEIFKVSTKEPTKEPIKKNKVEATKEVKKETSKPISSSSKTKKNKPKQVKARKNNAFYLSSYERSVVERIVMGESGGESYKGQVMVAFCILNACLKDNLQPSQVRKAYKYSGWKENPNKSVKRAVSVIFDDGHKPINDTPLYFYAPKRCNSSWHETQRYICTIGGHKFFGRW